MGITFSRVNQNFSRYVWSCANIQEITSSYQSSHQLNTHLVVEAKKQKKNIPKERQNIKKKNCTIHN